MIIIYKLFFVHDFNHVNKNENEIIIHFCIEMSFTLTELKLHDPNRHVVGIT